MQTEKIPTQPPMTTTKSLICIGEWLTRKQKRQLEEAKAKCDFDTLPWYLKQKTGGNLT